MRSFLVYPLTQWLEQPLVQTLRGFRLSVIEAFRRDSLFHVAFLVAPFALGNLDFAFALVSFSPSGVWVFPVEYVVLDFSGRVRCLVQRWIRVLREALDEFQHFLRCGELES